ncbi:T6SS immunity protein Tli4 family protein [Glaciimonas sp. PAMC28666]|uniref:T6SS immunity protein Tli4 family protein n=1 Tax=Glaciimonas sp. PAMC28666 TaxID=2807626 RepID=UPI0019663696|nr:T6SS immunity protein Tli4 family protein [Glaciimonas sp. PAMC28666]QRX83834.1 hypothetical protein JQN73_06340 [Glaciimonas sp. PAMC28666]
MMQNIFCAIAGLILTLALAACSHQPAPLTEQEKNTVNDLTSNLKTQCVGRYLIDMPADVSITGGAKIMGVEFDAKAMSVEEYRRDVVNREAELLATKHQDGYKFLLAHGSARGLNTHYFIHLENTYDENISRVIEAYKWDGGYRIKLQTGANDVTTSAYKDDATMQSIGNNVPQKTWLIFDLLDKVRGRDDDDIPTEPGVCFKGGFWQGKAGDNEEAGAQFVLRNHPDVDFGFETNTNTHESDTLLQRGSQINQVLKNTPDGKTVRKGRIKLQSMQAEEWLIAGVTPLKTIGNIFMLEANSKLSNNDEPYIWLSMNTASSNHLMKAASLQEASLSEGEALALWDVVSRTLIPRPNGF